jgi:hypothetical protein
MKQNLIMGFSASRLCEAWRRAFVAFLLPALVIFALGGCSAARLGYSNGETISYFWLNNYVDFRAEQKTGVREDIDALFAWHRQTQLPYYVGILTQAQKRANAPVTEVELKADYEELKSHLARLTTHALPAVADLALSLRPEQIANIERKFVSNNETYRKEFLQGDVEERQQKRFKRTLKQAEYWLGNLSSEQERRLRAVSNARPVETEVLMADRVKWQTTLVSLLRKIVAEKPSRPVTIALLQEFANGAFSHFGQPEIKKVFDARTAGTVHLVADTLNHATPEQKAHFVKTMQHWIDDFNVLSGRRNGSIPAAQASPPG